jgi:hypothetical protein
MNTNSFSSKFYFFRKRKVFIFAGLTKWRTSSGHGKRSLDREERREIVHAMTSKALYMHGKDLDPKLSTNKTYNGNMEIQTPTRQPSSPADGSRA